MKTGFRHVPGIVLKILHEGDKRNVKILENPTVFYL